MSTTFEVYPGVATIPTFEELLERTTQALHLRLASICIAARPGIGVCLRTNADHQLVPFDPSGPLTWPETAYAGFFVGDVPGCTDAYYWQIEDKQDCYEALLEPEQGQANRHLIEKCLEQDHYWSFRRSAGQPATINLTYGLLAGCLAEMTSGLVFSYDHAWEWERMPARPDEFLRDYLIPEHTVARDMKDWATRCILFLREELDG